MSLDDVRMMNNDILRKAMDAVPRGRDGHFDEEALCAEIERHLVPDIAKIRKKQAKEIAKQAQRPGATEPNGVLEPHFPGFETVAPTRAYYPDMLVKNELGKLIEQDRAPLETEKAKLARKLENLKRVEADARYDERMTQMFEGWLAAQQIDGRSVTDLTFGNFIRETGVWRPEPASIEISA